MLNVINTLTLDSWVLVNQALIILGICRELSVMTHIMVRLTPQGRLFGQQAISQRQAQRQGNNDGRLPG